MPTYSARFLDNNEPLRRGGQDPEKDPPVESLHASTMRQIALANARGFDRALKVMAGDRCVYVMHPDGSRTPPPGAKVDRREVCKADTGERCFCRPCRAERRASSYPTGGQA